MGFEKTLLLKTPLARGFANVPLMKAPLVKHPCICWKKDQNVHMCLCMLQARGFTRGFSSGEALQSHYELL